RPLPREVADERPGHHDGPAGDPLDGLGALAEQPVDGRSDGAEAEQPDARLAHPRDDSARADPAGTAAQRRLTGKIPRAWTHNRLDLAATLVGLRLRTVAALRPRSRTYSRV